MRKTVCVLAVGMVLIATGCKKNSDVLATYTNGKITRGEFHEWIDFKHFVKDSMLKSRKNQISKLEAMAIDRFAADEARKAGFDATDEFKAFADMANESQLMDILYTKDIKNRVKFEEQAVRVKQIFLKTADYKIVNNKRVQMSAAEMKNAGDATIAQAREIIARLDKGESFDELAKQYSHDFSRKSGGDIGYIVADMMPPELSKAAFSLKEGEHSKEPIVLAHGVYIIKVTDKKNLTEKNIEKVLNDKMQAARLKNRFYSRASREYLDALIKAPDVELHIDNAVSKNQSDVIFKVGEKVFTVADLNGRINLYTGMLSTSTVAPKITDEQKKSLAENFFKFELLKRVAVQKGIDRDPEYVRKVNAKKESILAREYLKKIGSSSLVVTEGEMRAEYDTNREKRYYTMTARGSERIKSVEPYSKVRDRIKKILESKKQSENIKKWKEDVLKKNNFRIIESKLEGD